MNLAKRITLVALFIVLAFSTLGTVTYAWLSVATVNSIESIGMGAAGEGLDISLNGYDFKKTIESEELHQLIKDVQLRDITTTDLETFTHLDNIGAVRNQDYIAFDVYFRSSVNSHIYLVDNDPSAKYNDLGLGTAVASKGLEWQSPIDFQYGPDDVVKQGEVRTYYGRDGVRIGIKEQNVEIYGVSDNRTSDELTKRIIDPSNELDALERGYGVSYGSFDLYNKIHPDYQISLPTVFPETVYKFTEFYEHNQNRPVNDNTLVSVLQDTSLLDQDDRIYRVGKATIYIWLEGYDADTLDAVLADVIQVRLKFKSGHPVD